MQPIFDIPCCNEYRSAVGSLQTEIFKRHPFESQEHEAALSVARTGDILLRPVESLLARFDLSVTQYNVLRILRGMGEERTTPGGCGGGAGSEGLPCGQIAQRMITREPDMTRLLDRLERREMITRCRPESDRRVVRIRLTAAALSLLSQIDEPLMTLHRKQFAHLDQQQLATLIQLLAAVRGGPPIVSPITQDGSS